MRIEKVEITCDNCLTHVVEGTEVQVEITLNERLYTSDWCQPCAQALEHKLNPDMPQLTCSCGYVAKTEGGLSTHRTRKGH